MVIPADVDVVTVVFDMTTDKTHFHFCKTGSTADKILERGRDKALECLEAMDDEPDFEEYIPPGTLSY